MKKLDLVILEGQLHRVLSIKEDKCLVINCIKSSMPFWTRKSYLEEKENLTLETVEIDSLSPTNKKKAYERYGLIAPIIPLVEDDYMRSHIISRISEDKEVSKQTLRKYLCLYLVYQSIGSLAPKEHKVKPLTQDEKNFRWALNKFYYSPLKHSLKGSYLLMLRNKYTYEDGSLNEIFPPFHRFKYFYKKTKNPQSECISRYLMEEFTPKLLLGSELKQALQILPKYDSKIRNAQASERLIALTQFYDIFYPSKMACEIYSKLYFAYLNAIKKKSSKQPKTSRGILGESDTFIKHLKESGLNYRQIANIVGLSYDYVKLVAYGKKNNNKNKTISNNGGKRIDWSLLDKTTLPKVIELIDSLNSSCEERPKKISIGLVERKAGLKERQLIRLPNCFEYVTNHIISQEEFWEQVVDWAINKLIEQNKPINITYQL